MPAPAPCEQSEGSTAPDKESCQGFTSAAVEVQFVRAAFAVVVYIHRPLRLPGRELEIVGYDARAFLKLLFQNRRDQIGGHRQQIYRQKIGGRIILLQEIAVNDPRRGGESQGLDAVHALLVKRILQLDSDGFGFILARRVDYNAAIPRAQVEHGFSSLELAQFEHAVDDLLGRRKVRRQQLLSFILLGPILLGPILLGSILLGSNQKSGKEHGERSGGG